MRRRLAILVFGALVAGSSPAHADNAEALKAFEEGRKLRDQRDFEKAANAFERSLAAEPSIGAYYNLAFSYEQLGRTRDALDAYRKALRMAKDKGDPREKETSEAVTRLLDTHNYVTVLVPDDVDKAAGVRVVVDGEVVPQKQLKGEVFRSGTQHEVVISAPGRKDARLKAGNKQPVTAVLGELYDSATPRPSPTPPPPPTDAPPQETSGGWGWQKWTGVGVSAAGLVTVAIGVVLTLDHASEQDALDKRRPDACRDKPDLPPLCTTAQRELVTQTNVEVEANKASAATTLPIVYGLGGALLVGGIILFATAPSSSSHESSAARLRVVPHVGLRESTLSLVGTF